MLMMIALFNGCQESIVEPDLSASVSTNTQKIDPDPKIIDAHAYGIVYNGTKPAKYATVQCIFAGNIIVTTTTNAIGEYDLEVCGGGYGYKTVKAIYNGQDGGAYFQYLPGMWDFNIDINIGTYYYYNY